MPNEVNAIGHESCLRGLAARGYTPQNVLDVGADDGNWSIRAMTVWPQSTYFLIEALAERSRELEALRANCPNVQYEIAAVAESSGERPFAVTEDRASSSFAFPGQEQYLREVYADNERLLRGLAARSLWEERIVPVFTLDEMFLERRFPQPQLIKIDVQGYELNVLQGGETLLAGCDLILLELQFFRYSSSMPLIHEVFAYMDERGFQPYEIVDVLRRPYDGAMGQCDVLFCRRGHWLSAQQRWF